LNLQKIEQADKPEDDVQGAEKGRKLTRKRRLPSPSLL